MDDNVVNSATSSEPDSTTPDGTSPNTEHNQEPVPGQATLEALQEGEEDDDDDEEMDEQAVNEMAQFLGILASMADSGELMRRFPQGFPIKATVGSNYNFYDLFSLLKRYNSDNISFQLIDEKGLAVGDGVARQTYLKCLDQIIDIGAFTVEGRFLVVNPESAFWDEDGNIFCFIRLIILINKDSIFPYHLSPRLLSHCMTLPLADFELDFFLDKKDPDLMSRLAQPSAADIIVSELGYEDKQDYIHYILDKNFHPSAGSVYEKTRAIYDRFATIFRRFDLIYVDSVISLDELLSGRYELTNDIVYRLFNFPYPEYEPVWREFIFSLTEEELTNMLLTFTNSISVDQNIKVEVKEIATDLNIQTCMRIVTIKKDLFADLKALNGIKLSFGRSDAITDYKFVDGALVRNE